jgi:hypothetical protein
MANPTVDALQAEYAELLEEFYDRWSLAAIDSKNGAYSADRFVSDVSANWVDAASAWLLPANTLLKGLKAVPQLKLEIPAAGGDATGAMRIPDPGQVTLASSNLVDMGGVQVPINAASVFPFLVRPQRILVVQVRGLGALTAGTTYQGKITDATNRTIADVFLTVTP